MALNARSIEVTDSVRASLGGHRFATGITSPARVPLVSVLLAVDRDD